MKGVNYVLQLRSELSMQYNSSAIEHSQGREQLVKETACAEKKYL